MMSDYKSVDRVLNYLILVVLIFGFGFISYHVGVRHGKDIVGINKKMIDIGQPYSITVMKVTRELSEFCIKDEDCMDLMEF